MTSFIPLKVGTYQAGKWTELGFKIIRYEGAGASFVTEGTKGDENGKFAGYWATEEEAKAAALRADAGEEAGFSFGSYSDD